MDRISPQRPIRIVFTSRDLKAGMESGHILPDLGYIIAATVHLPSLSERPSRLPLAEALWKDLFKTMNKVFHPLTEDMVTEIEAYGWPGNIRQLKSSLERCLALSGGTKPKAEHLLLIKESPPSVDEGFSTKRSKLTTIPGLPLPGQYKELIKRETAKVEVRILKSVLKHFSWNVTRTASYLGISRKGLQLKMKAYRLFSKDPRGTF